MDESPRSSPDIKGGLGGAVVVVPTKGTVSRPRPYFSGGHCPELCQLCPPSLPHRRQIKNSKCSSILDFLPLPRSPSLLFFFPFPFSFSCQCRIQGHCQKHIPHNQTSDGDSFPTACVSENSEIIPMFQRRIPWCSSGGRPAPALVCGFLFLRPQCF